ncbi:hypothetical protein [Streptomyces alanosinicus]|uniref:Integral membrane protein n=1 Tax=Streptomyces alanosinicus TaxID=68171 RepID=A0A919D7S8_9ACTN|nr:hypothetical protein [Streptomyces alanosinicus]GHE11536.1 hypothetical protein GCM10010339_71680 [Streptomyces alanosinicus]
MSTLDSRDAGLNLRKDPDLRKELDATVRARTDLGAEYDSALVDSFLEKVEQRIDDAVDRRVRRHLAEQRMTTARGTRRPKDADSWPERFGFAIVSLVLAVPLTAISGAFGGMTGMVATWAGIVGVNAAQAVRTNPEILSGRRRTESDG